LNISLQEQIKIYQSKALSAMVGNFIAATPMLILMLPVAQPVFLYSWFSILVFFILLRFFMTQKMSKITLGSDKVINQHYWIHFIMIGFIGASWGLSSFLFFPYTLPDYQVLFVLVIVGLSAGGIYLLSAIPFVCNFWLSLVILPMAWAMYNSNNPIHNPITLLIILHYLYLTVTISNIRKNLLESIDVKIELQIQARQDGLTGIANRRYFNQQLKNEWNRAKRKQHHLTLILIDLDFFKQLNDQYGHPKGDEVLQSVAQVLKNHIKRSGEFTARIGGEEFAVVLPDCDRKQAIHLAEKIRQQTNQLKFSGTDACSEFSVTMSMGIVSVIPELNSECSSLFKNTDKALYEAKEAGRDQFVAYS
jgi:diguanylate cyclase (GGDEF)-like protein